MPPSAKAAEPQANCIASKLKLLGESIGSYPNKASTSTYTIMRLGRNLERNIVRIEPETNAPITS